MHLRQVHGPPDWAVDQVRCATRQAAHGQGRDGPRAACGADHLELRAERTDSIGRHDIRCAEGAHAGRGFREIRGQPCALLVLSAPASGIPYTWRPPGRVRTQQPSEVDQSCWPQWLDGCTAIACHPPSRHTPAACAGPRATGAVVARDDLGALRTTDLYQCSGCSVVFTDPKAWRDGDGAEPPMPSPPSEAQIPVNGTVDATDTLVRGPNLATYGLGSLRRSTAE